ncbi:MAG: Co2+/Mg2+ efflux protein ApaG [Crocinitomicaceae bacterium]
MTTLTTAGIKISVVTNFRQDLSEINEMRFFFNYHISMLNENNFPVQLISREWYIFDSLGEPRIVTGLGVIGEQPILKLNESYDYASGCDLTSEMGLMKGIYTFKNLSTNEEFEVFVPTFQLEYSGKLN